MHKIHVCPFICHMGVQGATPKPPTRALTQGILHGASPLGLSITESGQKVSFSACITVTGTQQPPWQGHTAIATSSLFS